MARNFRIKKRKNKKRSLLFLQLSGDFDGASADQLLCLLNRKMPKVQLVSIDTNRLRNIHTFGLDVFRPRITRVTSDRVRISITGKFKERFYDQ